MHSHPIVLVILDGFGIRASKEANAILSANTPTWDHLWKHYPHTTLSACEGTVGLPKGQMGNSEVGHLTMGAGRVIEQDLTRINNAITNGSFHQNATLIKTFNKAKETKKRVHILGLLSPGGVHSHEDHIHSVIRLAIHHGIQSLFVHAFLDGRDTPPKSASLSLNKLTQLCQEKEIKNFAHIGSISGRYYAMDRDNRFDRIQKVYEILTNPTLTETQTMPLNVSEVLLDSYNKGETDEFVQPIRIHPDAWISDEDIVIFMNFRSDRARQLSYALTDPHFLNFSRIFKPKIAEFLTLTEYATNINATVLFPSEPLDNVLGEYLEKQKLKQLRIAETEKYAHVTFFFNGGRETPFEGEDRILVPSPKVSTYDQQPEMSAYQITQNLIEKIRLNAYDIIICNFANADMVGHTGNFKATVKAIETLDACLAKILEALKVVGGEMIITADHGNAECMVNESTKEPHTAHTHESVPFLYVGRPAVLSPHSGSLSDIAPTLLTLLNLKVPPEMTGTSLIQLLPS